MTGTVFNGLSPQILDNAKRNFEYHGERSDFQVCADYDSVVEHDGTLCTIYEGSCTNGGSLRYAKDDKLENLDLFNIFQMSNDRIRTKKQIRQESNLEILNEDTFQAHVHSSENYHNLKEICINNGKPFWHDVLDVSRSSDNKDVHYLSNKIYEFNDIDKNLTSSSLGRYDVTDKSIKFL